MSGGETLTVSSLDGILRRHYALRAVAEGSRDGDGIYISPAAAVVMISTLLSQITGLISFGNRLKIQ